MPRSDYSLIPYEVDEITSWLQDYLNENLPGMVTDALPEIHYKLKYIPSETSIWLKTGTISTTSTSWVLKYTCKFSDIAKLMIYFNSSMRFKCELMSGGTREAGIKLCLYDGSTETELAYFTRNGSYVWKSSDFDLSQDFFNENSVFRVYLKISSSDDTAQARNVQICGLPAVSETLNFTVIEDV